MAKVQTTVNKSMASGKKISKECKISERCKMGPYVPFKNSLKDS